jgi:hypothetical protein
MNAYVFLIREAFVEEIQGIELFHISNIEREHHVFWEVGEHSVMQLGVVSL